VHSTDSERSQTSSRKLYRSIIRRVAHTHPDERETHADRSTVISHKREVQSRSRGRVRKRTRLSLRDSVVPWPVSNLLQDDTSADCRERLNQL
jgi:hypothetical protein